jgi:hypothetical protein
MKIKNLKLKISLAIFIMSVVSCQLSVVTFAQTMSNDSYILNDGNLNSFGGKSTGSNYSVSSTGGGLAPGVYSGTNYKVRANFSYGAVASESSAFSFSISNSSINFGTITPGEPITRSNTLTISSPISGYQLTASENYPLKNPQGAVIANTTCDAGNCTFAVAGLWNSPLTYGFGYRCDNLASSDCSSTFSQSNYYRSFASAAQNQTPQSVMSNTQTTSNSQASITYKLNVAGTQPSGQYQNTVSYIATPSL